MSYQLHPAAEAELLLAARHYAKEASLVVAHALLREFERVAEFVALNPNLGTRSPAGLRVFPLRRE